MIVLFWYISKSVSSSLPVSAVHDVQDIFDFFNAIFRVGICWFKKIYAYMSI